MAFTFSLISLLGIFLTLLALFSLLRKYTYSIGEAFAYGVVIYFAIYSPIIQLLFILHIPTALYFVDIIIIIGSIITLSQNKNLLKSSFRKTFSFFKEEKIAILFLLLYFYLLLQALILPPDNPDSMQYSLSRVLMMQKEGSLFLKNFTEYRQVNYPIGFDILAYIFLRYYSDYFLSIFGFLSYSAILASTYSLTNKFFNNKKLSVTTTIIIGALSEIVLQSTGTKNDLPAAALATVCFLAAYNYFKERDLFSLILMVTALLLGTSFKANFTGFAGPFTLYFIIGIFNRYSILQLISDGNLMIRRYLFFAWIPAAILLCFILFGLNNYRNQGGFFGYPPMVAAHMQNDGLTGAVINFGRYLLQALSPPTQLGGKYLDQLHDYWLSGHQNIGAAKVQIDKVKVSYDEIRPLENYCWFGPLGCFIIIPAVFYGLFKGKMFVKFVSLSLLSYWFALSWALGWTNSYNRFFSLFFAGSGLCLSFFLDRLVKPKYYSLLICFSVVIMSYVALTNVYKPFFNNYAIRSIISHYLPKARSSELNIKKNNMQPGWLVFNWLKYAVNRDRYYENNFGQLGISSFKKLPHNKRVLLLGDKSWIFPFLIRRSDLDLTVGHKNRFIYENKEYNLDNRRDYEFIKSKYDYMIFKQVEPIKFLEPKRLIAGYKIMGNDGTTYCHIFNLYDLDPNMVGNN